MKLHHLKPAPGSKTSRNRVGRGEGGTGGKTAGRGTKGSGARNEHARCGSRAGRCRSTAGFPSSGFKNRNKESPTSW